jgi:predicted DNA-binding antitoxin AbrB/MazE fold protein
MHTEEIGSMPEVIEAIYAQGVFKPLQALDIPDGQHVRLVIETSEVTPTEEILALAAQVYEGLSPADVEAIETIACKRDDFFGEATS